MRTCWTEALLDRVRERAAAGDSVIRAADALNVSPRSLSVIASQRRIRFHSRTKPERMPAARSSIEARRTARDALAREIAAAKAEAPQAPLYRGWPG